MKPSIGHSRPELYALIAAILNGTIGPLNRLGFLNGASHHQLAFMKCFGAFILLLAICISNSKRRAELVAQKSHILQFIILSFLGVFCLYFFETWAFSQATIPLVSFLTYAAGGITLILSSLFLQEQINRYRISSFVAIILGIYVIFSGETGLSGSILGVCLALIGGLGYSLFIFTSKLFQMRGGIASLVWLFGFGSLYLGIPYFREGPSFPGIMVSIVILGLIVLPTIGGFYCTTMAVKSADASIVQIIETSDPLFATIMSFLFFREQMGIAGYAGSLCIMAGLLLALKRGKRGLSKYVVVNT